MSVTLFEKEKFLRVKESLEQYIVPAEVRSCDTWKGRVYRVFGLDPFRESSKLKEKIRTFCEDLYRANQLAYNWQYPDDAVKVEILDFSREVLPFENDCQLLKSLKAIRYNCYTNGGKRAEIFKETFKTLDDLIETLKDKIIENLPEYQNARWA